MVQTSDVLFEVNVRSSAVIFCVLLTTSVFADEANETFDLLFGQRIEQVNKTFDRSDDVDLAGRMLEAAIQHAENARLATLLCEAASELGSRHSSGYSTAVRAYELLIKHNPTGRQATELALEKLLRRQMVSSSADEREAAANQLVGLWTKRGDAQLIQKNYNDAATEYRRAFSLARQKSLLSENECRQRMDEAVRLGKLSQRIKLLQEKLLRDADVEAALELVKIHLVELPDTDEARTYLARVEDEQFKRLASLALRPSVQLNATEALEVGQWFADLGKGQERSVERRTLALAQQYLEAHLELNTKEGLARTRAMVLRDNVRSRRHSLFFEEYPAPTGAVLVMSFDKPTIQRRGENQIVADISGRKNHGVLKGGEFGEGVSGQALKLIEAGQHILTEKNVGITKHQPRTISVFIKGENWTHINRFDPFLGWGVNGKARHFHLANINGTFALWGYGYGQDWVPGIRRPRGVWQHHAIVYDGELVRWYIDAKPIGKTFKKRYNTADTPLSINQNLGGWIDELCVFSRALTAQEVAFLHKHAARGVQHAYGP